MKKKNPAQIIPQFFTEVIAEMKKVTWPTKQETIRLTTLVVIISLIIGFYIGIIDMALATGLELLTQR